MIRLGLRLALADGRRSAFSVALTAAAVAIGTAILLFAISFQPALGDRDSRQAWRQPMESTAAQPRLLLAVLDDRYSGQPFLRVLVAPLTAATAATATSTNAPAMSPAPSTNAVPANPPAT